MQLEPLFKIFAVKLGQQIQIGQKSGLSQTVSSHNYSS